jgi:hypothetical protein
LGAAFFCLNSNYFQATRINHTNTFKTSLRKMKPRPLCPPLLLLLLLLIGSAIPALGQTETAIQPRPKSPGYYNSTTLGAQISSHLGIRQNWGIYSVNGIQWNRHLQTGIGTGFELVERTLSIPIYAEAKWRFIDRRISPFVGIMTGAALPISQGNGLESFVPFGRPRPSFTTGLQLGVQAFASKHLAFALNVGYRYYRWRDCRFYGLDALCAFDENMKWANVFKRNIHHLSMGISMEFH